MPYADPEMGRAYCRRYYATNRERIRAMAAARRVDNAERSAERGAKWRAENPEKVRQYARTWYLANRSNVLEGVKIAYARRLAENPSVVRAANRERTARRRARQRQAFVEPIDPLLVWERDEGICGICGDPANQSDWHLDHIIAIARGGAHSYANVQVSHPRCNRRKAAS